MITLLSILCVFWLMAIGGLFGLTRELRTQWRENQHSEQPYGITGLHIMLMFLGVLVIIFGILLTQVIYLNLIKVS
jgi:uncharacterized BrkB/YihY/UPF0761 family membrane protein